MQKEIGYEERERKTPILGYILLIAMAIAVFWLGNAALSDLNNVPSKPELLSDCSSPYVVYHWGESEFSQGRQIETFPYEPVKTECQFSEIENKYGIPQIFEETKDLRKEVSDLQIEINQKENELNNLRGSYQIGLIEKTVQPQEPVYNTQDQSERIKTLETEVPQLKVLLEKKQAALKPYEDKLKTSYENLMKEYRTQWRWHDFYSFLLQIIFVAPLFYILVKQYFALARKNSPYLIIITFLLIPASIFILQIVFIYFWGLLLARILEVIWTFINQISLLKSLVSYVAMIAAAGLFGGLVYMLQKRIFSAKRVALRRLRENKCPNCSFSLKVSDGYCSNCGHKLLKKCDKCGGNKYADLPVCQHCGDIKEA